MLTALRFVNVGLVWANHIELFQRAIVSASPTTKPVPPAPGSMKRPFRSTVTQLRTMAHAAPFQRRSVPSFEVGSIIPAIQPSLALIILMER
jgi:hypothetical protein